MDLTWCFYACEEVGRAESGLLPLWQQRPDLLAGDAAILGEPTGALVEAGCQGTMRILVSLRGVRAHTARPFTGRNAIHRLGALLQTVAEWESRTVVLDGCTYAEQLQAVAVDGGVAGERGARRGQRDAELSLRARPAPGRRRGVSAPALGRDLQRGRGRRLGRHRRGRWRAARRSDHPLLAALVAKTGAPPRAKVGWTDVASFWEHGVPAANFGPGTHCWPIILTST